MKAFFFILLTLIVFALGTKGADPPFAIKLNNDNPVQFCSDLALVAKDLTIEGSPNIKSMKVSITQGFIAGEDMLIYNGNLNQSTPFPGTLVLTGGNTVQEYVNAIREVSYKNSKTVPTNGIRKITISLSEAAGDPGDYLPETGHYYRFISLPGITWTAAEAEAKSDLRMYYGFRGYLATITSQAENDFIKTKTSSMGWIGAADAANEGDWRWVTGPEGLQDGGKGFLFWKGTGYLAKTNPSVYGAVKDANGVAAYHNWNRWDTPYSSSLGTNTWEPNQSGDEDYAHITIFSSSPNDSYKWNDLPNSGGGITGDYYPKGYIIEYGGMPNDPVLNLAATLDLQVNTISFDPVRQFTICEGDAVRLNDKGLPCTYSWSPLEYLSSASVFNPVASPVSTTTYIASATNGECQATENFSVVVKPKPVSLLKAEENICTGANITLDPGAHEGFLWGTGQTDRTINVSIAGEYEVKLTDNGCSGTFSTKVIVHDYPSVDLVNLQSLICGNKTTTAAITTSATDYSLVSADNRATVSGLNVSVPAYGIYPMIYKSSFYPACTVTKNFDLSFFGIPKVDFSIDSTTCYHYNLSAVYKGDADSTIAEFTWVFGGDTIAEGIGLTREKIPLGVNQSKRDLFLKVEQNGCSDVHTLSDIRVIPTLSLAPKDTIRCLYDLFEFSAYNTETGVTYDWDFGDGEKGTGNLTTHQYAMPGRYDIGLTVTTDKKCTNSILNKDFVFAAPVPSVGFSLDSLVCLNKGSNEIAYLGTGDQKDSYHWDLSGFDPEEIIQHPDTAQGPFIFNLKNKPEASIGLSVVSKYGCRSDTSYIMVKRKPDFSLSVTSNQDCTPLTTGFEGIIADNRDKVDFTWDFGDGSTGTGATVAHTYFDPGNKYNIGLNGVSSVTGCSDTLFRKDLVFAYPKPLAAFSFDHGIVYNDKPDIQFNNLSSGGAINYLWDFDDGTTSTDQHPSHHFLVMGHKNVILQSFNEYNCSDTVSRDVLIAFSRIFPPNAFSPNAPNAVDREYRLTSEGMNSEGYHLIILSRWNDIVFETKEVILGWDGRLKNGQYAPAGSYIWILNFTDFLGRRHRQSGNVSLFY